MKTEDKIKDLIEKYSEEVKRLNTIPTDNEYELAIKKTKITLYSDFIRTFRYIASEKANIAYNRALLHDFKIAKARIEKELAILEKEMEKRERYIQQSKDKI